MFIAHAHHHYFAAFAMSLQIDDSSAPIGSFEFTRQISDRRGSSRWRDFLRYAGTDVQISSPICGGCAPKGMVPCHKDRLSVIALFQNAVESIWSGEKAL